MLQQDIDYINSLEFQREWEEWCRHVENQFNDGDSRYDIRLQTTYRSNNDDEKTQ